MLSKVNYKNDNTVRVRVNTRLKDDAECVLRRLGFSISEAVKIYLAQIVLHEGIPFEVRIPNETTLKTFTATDRGKNLIKAKSVREIFARAGF